MPLEAGNHIPELNANNPLGSDAKSEGDDHLRLIKRATLGSFPAFVGTIATPKSVTLTEDQINDAALKSAAQTIGGAWTHTGVQKFTNPTSGPNSSLNVEGTVPGVMWHETDGGVDEKDWRIQANGEEFTINTRNDAGNGGATAFKVKRLLTVVTGIEHIIGGVNVAENVTRDLGSLLIEPRTGTRRKVGFRNPNIRAVGAGGLTLSLDNEGEVLTLSSTTATITVPHLEVGFTCRIIVKANSLAHLVGDVANIAWRAGNAATATGNFDVGQNSIVELYQSTTSITDLFGNGISGPI